MARKPIDYWEKRQTELMKRIEKRTEKTIDSLIKAYEQATKDINKEISKIFKNYAKDSGLSKETLIQLLNKKETETHYKNLLEVINNNITDEKLKKKLLTKYNAPAYSYRISRYEALQQNIDIELKKLANIEQQITEIRYVDTINETYYRNIFNVQQNLGYAFSFNQIDKRTINMLLNENWVSNENFSQRIWNNSEKLGEYLKTQLTASSMSGKSIQKISKELSEYMKVGLYNATRLVRTEVNHFANETEMLSYEELDIEKYKFIATLDNRTCEHCAELDNKIFKVKDRKPGKNCPPIHSNDRCTTVAEFDDDVLEGLQRRARNEKGNPILVQQDMNYKEWYDIYVKNPQEQKIRPYIVGEIDKNIYKRIADNITTKEVVLLPKQIEHIEEKHKGVYLKYKNEINNILDNPDYIFKDPKHKNTALLIRKYDNNVEVVLKLNTDTKNNFKNSIITMWEIKDKRLERYKQTHEIIYKKE